MATVLKICWGPWENASRDKREMSVYRDLGYDVIVMAAGNQGDKGRIGSIDSFPVRFYSMNPLGIKCPIRINQLASLLTWSRYARKYHADIISGHDFTGWMIGWKSVWFKRKKPLFIYDAHEFEIGRNTKRGRVRRKIIRTIEKYILKKSAFSIVVNDSIADEMKREYKLDERPLVVRNTPNQWIIDKKICDETRRGILDCINLKRDSKCGIIDISEQKESAFIVMYHGALFPDRGIESLIKVLAINPDMFGFILGNGNDEYIAGLKALVEELKVADRCCFHTAVPLPELWKYLGAVDLSYSMIVGHSKSYYLSLPNKFFESIQAETPIIASAYPEMKHLVDKYHIGLTADPENIDEINMCIERFRQDERFYSECKRNLLVAKKELCWENEKKKLQAKVAGLI